MRTHHRGRPFESCGRTPVSLSEDCINVAKYRFSNERRSHATSQDDGDAVAAVAGGTLVSGPSGQCLPRKCKAVTVYSHSQNSEAFIVQVKMDTIDTEVMQIHLMDDT